MALLRSLLVNLGLNSAQYRSDLEKTKRQTKKDFGEMAKSAKDYGGQIATAVTATSAAVTAAGGFVVMLAKQNKELQLNADLAGMAASEYQSLEFAYKQFGLTVDQVSDIYKDSSERIGEWLSSQTGPLQDFGDVMGYSKEQISEFAESMRDATGQEVLQAMVNQMQAAGVSTKEMSFALEGMASEATRMIPALIDNGKQVRALTDQYDALNKSLALDEEEIKNYKELSEAFDLFTSTAYNSMTKVIAPLADEMAELAEATAHWVAAMVDGSESQLTQRLVDLTDEAREMRTQIKYLENRGWSNIFQDDADEADKLRKKLVQNRAEYEKTQKELMRLNGTGAPEALELVIKPKVNTSGDPISKSFGEMFGGTDKVDEYALQQSKILSKQAEAMAQRLIQSQMSLEQQYETEREFLEKNLDDYSVYLEAKAALNKKYEGEQAKVFMATQMAVMNNQQQMLSIIQQGLGGLQQYAEEGSAIATAAFIASQGVAAAQVYVSAEMAKWQAASTIPNLAAQQTAMGLIDMQKSVSLALIAAQTGAGLAGQFHNGGTVPREGTYLLDGQETVYTKKQHEALMDKINSGGNGGGNVTVQVGGNIYGDKETQRIISAAAQQGYSLVAQDARTNGVVYKQMRK